jgi:hypothetical protein
VICKTALQRAEVSSCWLVSSDAMLKLIVRALAYPLFQTSPPLLWGCGKCCLGKGGREEDCHGEGSSDLTRQATMQATIPLP